MYIIGGFDGQRLNDMHHISLPWTNNEDKVTLARRRTSSRPFSSTSGFIASNNLEIG
jgi:hypothetical protein